jgi:hypothetical protein
VLIFERSVEAFPEGLIVEPYCVLVGGVHGFVVVSVFEPPLSVKLEGNPALVHVIAREDAKTFDHDCPYETVENKNTIEIRGERCQQARLI